MAITGKPLYINSPGTSTATLYTVPAATTTKVTNILICNTTTTAATIRLYIVPSGGTAGASNAIVYDRSIAANDTVMLDLNLWMSTGYFIAGSQGTSGALAVNISGGEVA